jgi:hypothetical protein
MQLKRFAALLALAAGFVGIPACLAGAIAAWALGAKLERTNTTFFTMVEKGLAAAQDRTRKVQERVKESKITSGELDQKFRDWDRKKTKEAFVSRLEIEGRADKISGYLAAADSWLEKCTESILSVKQVVELGNTLGASLEPARVQDAFDAIVSLRITLQQTELKVVEIRAFAVIKTNESEEIRLTRVAKLLGRVVVTIGEIDTRLDESITRLSELQTHASQWKTKISACILVACIASCLLLAWIAAGQAALCQWGWANLKPRDVGPEGAGIVGGGA